MKTNKTMKKLKVLIDNGHGSDTAGKRSPDGRLREYAYVREIAERVEKELHRRGVDAERIVKEMWDVSLAERCRRVNRHPAGSTILVSIHCNAAGHGQWMNARGWSGWVYRQCSERAKRLAGCLFDATKAQGLQVRTPSRSQKYWTAGFYILKHTACPAVLTENFFQDNREDVAFLLSEAGKAAVVRLHVEGIMKYIESL